MISEKITHKYEKLCGLSSDINEHMPTLKKYSSECETVVEFGVRGIVSTWALLAGKPKKVVSYDIVHPAIYGANLSEVVDAANESSIEFEFINGNTLDVSIPECDMLFIDTLHEAGQTIRELRAHANKVKKYIVFHDTVTFGITGELGGLGICHAIDRFLGENTDWQTKEIFTNNNGLTILERVK